MLHTNLWKNPTTNDILLLHEDYLWLLRCAIVWNEIATLKKIPINLWFLIHHWPNKVLLGQEPKFKNSATPHTPLQQEQYLSWTPGSSHAPVADKFLDPQEKDSTSSNKSNIGTVAHSKELLPCCSQNNQFQTTVNFGMKEPVKQLWSLNSCHQ